MERGTFSCAVIGFYRQNHKVRQSPSFLRRLNIDNMLKARKRQSCYSYEYCSLDTARMRVLFLEGLHSSVIYSATVASTPDNMYTNDRSVKSMMQEAG